MTLSAATILGLAVQCAPNVAASTVAAIVATESRGNPFAVNVNRGPRVARFASAEQAAIAARRYVAAGYSVDLGLGQINSRNLRWLGLDWRTVFDPCANIAALGRVMSQNYRSARANRGPQAALRVALSHYNTGSPSRGFRNGYVDRVIRNAGVASDSSGAPDIATAETANRPAVAGPDDEATSPAPAFRDAAPPSWNLFARAAYERGAAPAVPSNRSKSIWSD